MSSAEHCHFGKFETVHLLLTVQRQQHKEDHKPSKGNAAKHLR